MPKQNQSSTSAGDPTSAKRQQSPKQTASTTRRRQRVDEYEEAGLKHAEPFEACMAAIQADQIRISFSLGAAVKQMLANSDTTLDKIREMEASLNIYLRVTRQIERYRQLELRQAEIQQAGAASQMSARQNRQTNGTGEPRRPAPK